MKLCFQNGNDKAVNWNTAVSHPDLHACFNSEWLAGLFLTCMFLHLYRIGKHLCCPLINAFTADFCRHRHSSMNFRRYA